jgi:hypothetical protein
MVGNVKLAVKPNVLDGYKIKYWIGLLNFEHVCVPHVTPFALPISGNWVWSTYKITYYAPIWPKL